MTDRAQLIELLAVLPVGVEQHMACSLAETDSGNIQNALIRAGKKIDVLISVRVGYARGGRWGVFYWRRA